MALHERFLLGRVDAARSEVGAREELRQMTDVQRIARFRSHGYDARLLPDRRIVILLNGLWWRVAGGDFRHPTLIAIPTPEGESVAKRRGKSIRVT